MERIQSLAELDTFAKTFIASLVPRTDQATVITLSGELGAGKTAFVQCCAKVLGVSEEITSPTFVIENRYEVSDTRFSHLVHIDAYRLEGGESLAPLRFAEDVKKPQILIMLEWPEQVASALQGLSVISLTFTHTEGGVREIAVTYPHV